MMSHEKRDVTGDQATPGSCSTYTFELTGVRLDDNLCKTGITRWHRPECSRAGRPRHRKRRHILIFCDAECKFLLEVDRLRDETAIHLPGDTEDIICSNYTLVPGYWCKVGRSDHIPACVHIRHTGLHMLVNNNLPGRSFFKTVQHIRTRYESGRNQYGISFTMGDLSFCRNLERLYPKTPINGLNMGIF